VAACPHCNEKTIGVHHKWWSSPAHPVKCTDCGGLSYNSRWQHNALSRVIAALPILILVAIWLTRSLGALWIGALIVIGALLYQVIAFYRAPMAALAEVAAQEARHYERIGMLILGVLALIVIAVMWWHRAS
jgi:hypothetical protein